MTNYRSYININTDIKCDKTQVFNYIYKRTYLNIKLQHNNNNKNNKASIILMNPSSADCNESDNTVNQLTDYFNNNQFSEITILNLFPIYDPYSSKLYNTLLSLINLTSPYTLQEILNNNLNTISQYTSNSSHIVLAWGDCPLKNTNITNSSTFNSTLYYNTIYNILNLLRNKQNLYCFTYTNYSKLSEYGNPYHPSRKNITGITALTLDTTFLTLS